MLHAILAVLVLATSPADAEQYVRAHGIADVALGRGDLRVAEIYFRECLELSPENPTVAYGLACVEAQRGSVEAALQWLESASRWGYRDAAVAEWDEDLLPLREEARYRAVLAKMRGATRLSSKLKRPIVGILPSHPDSYVASVAVDPTGRYVIVGDTQGRVVLVEPFTGAVVKVVSRLPGRVCRLAVNPQGDKYAALCSDGVVYLRSFGAAGSQVELAPVVPNVGSRRPSFYASHLGFAEAGHRLLVSARGYGASLWTTTGDRLGIWEDSAPADLCGSASFVLVGDSLVSRDEDSVSVRDIDSGELIRKLPLSVRYATLHPDEHRLATGHEDGHARLWELASGELLSVYPVRDLFDTLPVGLLAFSPDGRRLAATTASKVNVSVFDTESAEVVVENFYLGGRICGFGEVAWAPDSDRLWLAFANGVSFVHGWSLSEVYGPPSRVRHGLSYQDELGPERSLGLHALGQGEVPVFGSADDGIGVVIRESKAIVGMDSESGEALWCTPWMPDGAAIHQAPAGYFSSELDQLHGLLVQRKSLDKEPLELADVAHQLFDPKRVRAARNGVPLVPVELPR